MRVLLESTTFLYKKLLKVLGFIVVIVKDHLLTIYQYNGVSQINHFQILMYLVLGYLFTTL